MQVRMTVGRVAFTLLLCSGLTGPATLDAQGPDGRWPLQPRSSMDRIVAPFMDEQLGGHDISPFTQKPAIDLVKVCFFWRKSLLVRWIFKIFDRTIRNNRFSRSLFFTSVR